MAEATNVRRVMSCCTAGVPWAKWRDFPMPHDRDS
jgi:hypothetical protein